MLINHILFIFKLYIYNCRGFNSVNIYFLKSKITKIRDIEGKISKQLTHKNKNLHGKWDIVKEIRSIHF